MRKGFAAIFILGIALAILVLGTAIYIKQSKKVPISTSQLTTPNKIPLKPSASPTSQSNDTANWKTYSSSNGRFTIKYPRDWIVSECINKPDFLMIGFGYAADSTSCGNGASSDFGISIVSIILPLSKSMDSAKAIYKQKDMLNFNQEDVMINGKTSIKTTGTYNISGNPLDKAKMIDYLVQSSSGDIARITYDQLPSWMDKSDIFEQMIKTLIIN